jgi:hypothetical protein
VAPDVQLAADQLARMRGMNALYHRRFFSDIRFTATAVLALLAAGAAIDRALFLAVPFVALLGACQTAFDASYLIFSRQYATRLERYLNAALGRDVLIAHRLEDAYLFPLDVRKVVTVPLSGGFTWFGFMTLLYTALGVIAFATGAGLGAPALPEGTVTVAYWTSLGALTAGALATGGWWFVGGVGERRLAAVLDRAFPE